MRENVRPHPSNPENQPKAQLNEIDQSIIAEIDEVINNISLPLVGNCSY